MFMSFLKINVKYLTTNVKNTSTYLKDAILTAMDKMVIPRVEMAVRSMAGSSGHRPNSVIQNPDRRDFTVNTGKTPLMSTSRRLHFNIDQNGYDETRDVENFEDGDFLALKHNYDRRAHTHRSTQYGDLVTGVKKYTFRSYGGLFVKH